MASRCVSGDHDTHTRRYTPHTRHVGNPNRGIGGKSACQFHLDPQILTPYCQPKEVANRSISAPLPSLLCVVFNQ